MADISNSSLEPGKLSSELQISTRFLCGMLLDRVFRKKARKQNFIRFSVYYNTTEGGFTITTTTVTFEEESIHGT